MLKVQPGREVFFVHGALNGRVHAFRELVRQLADLHANLKVHYRYSEVSEEDRIMHWHDSEGFIDAELLEDMLPERDADYYFCGPKPLWSAFIIICSNGASPPRRFTSSSLGHARRWKARKPSQHDAQEWRGAPISKALRHNASPRS